VAHRHAGVFGHGCVPGATRSGRQAEQVSSKQASNIRAPSRSSVGRCPSARWLYFAKTGYEAPELPESICLNTPRLFDQVQDGSRASRFNARLARSICRCSELSGAMSMVSCSALIAILITPKGYNSRESRQLVEKRNDPGRQLGDQAITQPTNHPVSANGIHRARIGPSLGTRPSSRRDSWVGRSRAAASGGVQAGR
jgi:hypothetical protein